VNKYTIIPSSLQYKSAPSVDQEISLSLEQQSQQMTQYDRSQSVSLAQIYDDERQSSTIFRPTFKVNYFYGNTYTGTTNYTPFVNTLYYVNAINSISNNKWVGFPQYYEFDFYRPNVSDQHITYRAKSAYTYNWTYYVSYPYSNNYDIKGFHFIFKITFKMEVMLLVFSVYHHTDYRWENMLNYPLTIME
jgi:hypothetical protein